jgi:GTP-binding protein
MQAMDIPYQIVLTKSDKLNKTEYAERLRAIEEELYGFIDDAEIIPFSAQTGEGADKIQKIIEELRG